MIFEKPLGARRSDPGEEAFEMLAGEVPDGGWMQLLRSAS
jgi:hypothetical protein